MISVIQRVNWARLRIKDEVFSEIDTGIMALVGLEKGDTQSHVKKMLDKLLAYRIFPDQDGKMNLSLSNISGGLMLVSQFTLAADTDKGLRPGFSSAMPPGEAELLYDYLVDVAREKHANVVTGQFAADMQIELENNGPVTFSLKV